MCVDIVDRQKVRALQHELGLNDKQVAELCRLPHDTYSRWKRGRAPDLSTVVRLYVALDVAGGTLR